MEEEIKKFQVWISQKWWALMIALNPRIESLLNHKWQALKRLLYVLFFIILCVIIASRFIEIKKTDWIVGLIGVFGLLNWIFVITWGTTRRYQFDRKLAHSNFKRLAYILLLVITIPCALYLLYLITPPCFHKYSALDRFNDSSISPFLNHGNFHFTKSVISLVGTFFLSGVLVSMLVSFINQEAERWKEGELTYKFRISNYRIVIGGHETAPSLIKQLVEKYKNDKVIVYTSREIPSFRCEVEACLDTEHKKESVIFYRGYRDSMVDLKRLNLEWDNLKAIYILGESRVNGKEETSHDTLNMTCFNLIKGLRGKKQLAIDCYVFFEYQTTSIVFQKYAKLSICESLHFIPYNFYELHAQKAIGWEACLGHTNVQLDRFDRKNVNVDKHVHLVIIGMSKMGQALGLEAIRVCHYPNFAKSQMLFEYGKDSNAEELMRKRITKITFIDCRMKKELETFKCRHKRLFDEVSWSYVDCFNYKKSKEYPIRPDAQKNNPDIELEFINGRLQLEFVSNYLQKLSEDESAVVTIASCISKSNQSLASILCLPKKVLENAEIIVYQPDSSELVDSICVNNTPNKIKAFGKISQSVDLKHIEVLESMARRIYYVYSKSRRKHTLMDFTIDSMNDFEANFSDNIYWKIEETWRWANRYHASAIWQKMHYIEDIENIERIIRQGITEDDGYDCVKEDFEGLMARVEHNRYCLEQWLLDRPDRGSNYHAFKTYRCLKIEGNSLTEFPTNDQVMTMAIPYIIGDNLIKTSDKEINTSFMVKK